MTTTTRQSKTTTYVARWNAGTPVTEAFARTSPTMAYTHAVVVKSGATTWHLTETAAVKAQRTNYPTTGRVVAVEAHQGGKATVLARLATEATEAPAPVEPTPAPARSTRTWDATATETHPCAGACGETKPARSFPTTGKDGQRGVECRSCRDARKVAA